MPIDTSYSYTPLSRFSAWCQWHGMIRNRTELTVVKIEAEKAIERAVRPFLFEQRGAELDAYVSNVIGQVVNTLRMHLPSGCYVSHGYNCQEKDITFWIDVDMPPGMIYPSSSYDPNAYVTRNDLNNTIAVELSMLRARIENLESLSLQLKNVTISANTTPTPEPRVDTGSFQPARKVDPE